MLNKTPKLDTVRKSESGCSPVTSFCVELMQTELHHIQTLTVMSEVFRRGMLEELQLDSDCVARIFPCLDPLLLLHRNLFRALQECRQAATQKENSRNYLIHQIGDVLLQQVGIGKSAVCARSMLMFTIINFYLYSSRMKMLRRWSRCTQSSAVTMRKPWISSKSSSSRTKNFKTLSE